MASLLAAAEVSAGLVFRLPEELEPELTGIQEKAGASQTNQGAFKVLVGGARRLRSPLVQPGAPARDVLERLARVAAPGRVVMSAAGQVSTLKDPTADVCTARLGQRLKSSHTGGDVLELVSAVTADAVGGRVPGGFVGACLARRERVTPIRIEAGTTLEEALNTIALHAEGTVWVAVQSAKGECSLGVVQTADEGGGVCIASISPNLGR
jgi:hypothetical protein